MSAFVTPVAAESLTVGVYDDFWLTAGGMIVGDEQYGQPIFVGQRSQHTEGCRLNGWIEP